MPLVVDASWALPDESSAYAEAVLTVAREIANGLAVAYLRRRLTSVDERAFLAALSHLIIDVEEASAAFNRYSRWNGSSDALWPYSLRRSLRRSCIARKTDPCHSRHGDAQGCRTVRDCDFPARVVSIARSNLSPSRRFKSVSFSTFAEGPKM